MAGTIKLDERSPNGLPGWRSDAAFKRSKQIRRPIDIKKKAIARPTDAEDADEFVTARFAEGPEHFRITYGISVGHKIAMASVRTLNDGGVTMLAGSESKNRGTANGVSIDRELEMVLLRRYSRRGG